MPEHKEFELRVVEVTKPQAAAPTRERLVIPTAPSTAPSRADALDAVRATNGAAAVIKAIPALEDTAAWVEVGHWTVNGASGVAADEPWIWDCDFVGYGWNMFDGYANGYAYFAGAEDLGGIIPPQKLSGQVWCYLNVPAEAHYVFLAELLTYPDQYFGADYVALVECSIDSTLLGVVTLHPGDWLKYPFVANLEPGIHRFAIRQERGGVFFSSLSAWIVSPPVGPSFPPSS